MASSPLVEVKDGAGPWVPTTNGVDVTPGNTISIRLQTPGPVSSWTLQIFGVDEVTASAPVLIGVNPITHLVATPSTVVTFTMPAGVGIGRALILRSAVDGGGSGFTNQFGIYVLTTTLQRVGAVGEKFEGDPIFGWARKLNPLIRAPGPGSPSGPATGDLGGTYPSPSVLKINGTTVPVTGVPDIGRVLTVTGAGTAAWAPAASGFTAGGDLTGTSSNQTVSYVRGIPSPDPLGKADGSLVEVFNTPTGVAMPGFAHPRAMVSDGTYLYVGEHNQAAAFNPIVWKLAVTGSVITAVSFVDLSASLGTAQNVRDLAQDATYLYAACWNAGNVAIIDKATMTVVGWGWVGPNERAVSVCADGAGNFYCYVTPNGGFFTGIQKFSTAACLGQPPNTVAPSISLPTLNGRFIRFGGGKIWFSNGGNAAPALSRVDPITLTVEASVPTISGSSGTALAVYAFGDVWVSSSTTFPNPWIWRVDPTTLLPIAAINPGGPSTAFGLEVGPDSAGTPNSWLFATFFGNGKVGAIDPGLNTWQGSVTPVNAFHSYEGLGVLGNFVYLACFQDEAGPSGIDYYNPVTTAVGTIATAPLVDSWALRYREISGDVRGPIRNTLVKSIQGVTTPPGSTAFSNAMLQVSTVFVSLRDVAWDSTGELVWIADMGQSILFSYDPASEVLSSYPWTGFSFVTGLLRIVADANYVYAAGLRSIGTEPTVLVFSRTTGALLGMGACTSNAAATGLALDGAGNLWVASTGHLDKFVITSLVTGSYALPALPAATLALTNAKEVAWDGTYLYVSGGATADTVWKVDPTTPSILLTYTEVVSVEPNLTGLLCAFGSVWVADTANGRIVRLNPATMLDIVHIYPFTPGGIGSYYLAADTTRVWVSNRNNYGLYRIDPTTNVIVTNALVTDLTDQHQGLAFNGTDRMWNAVSLSVSCLTAYATSPEVPTEMVRYTPKQLLYVSPPPPSGAASGDLSGTYPSPTVYRVNGTTIPVTGVGEVGKYLSVSSAGVANWLDITKLQAVVISATPPTVGQVLTATGATAANWQTPSGGGGAVQYPEGRWARLPVRNMDVLGYSRLDESYRGNGSQQHTFGPNASWGGISTFGWTLRDFCDWVGLGFTDATVGNNSGGGLAVLATTTGGGNRIWYINSRATGVFWADSASGDFADQKSFDVATATGSSTWTILESIRLTSGSGILVLGNPTTSQIARVNNTPALMEAALTLPTTGNMSRIYAPHGFFQTYTAPSNTPYAYVVCGGVLYRLTVGGGLSTLSATAISGLPAGILCKHMTSDGRYLYVPDSANLKIHKIDLITQTFVSSITTTRPTQNVTYDGKNLWYSDTTAWPFLEVIDTSGTSVKSFAQTDWTSTFGNDMCPVFDGRYIYFVCTSSPGIRRIDPETFNVVENTANPAIRARVFMDGASTADLWVQTPSNLRRVPTQREQVKANHVSVERSFAIRARQVGASSGGPAQTINLDTTLQSAIEVSTKTAATTIYLPRRPHNGMIVTIHDKFGRASVNNITIKTRPIYSPASPGNGTIALVFAGYELQDLTVQNSDFRSTGVHPGDMIVITAPSAVIYRVGVETQPMGTTNCPIAEEVGVTTGSGRTYKIYEQMQAYNAGSPILAIQDVMATNFGFRRYQYIAPGNSGGSDCGWHLHDAR